MLSCLPPEQAAMMRTKQITRNWRGYVLRIIMKNIHDSDHAKDFPAGETAQPATEVS
jgi:hypothetical protein